MLAQTGKTHINAATGITSRLLIWLFYITLPLSPLYRALIHVRAYYAGGNRLYTQALYRTYVTRNVEIAIFVVYISKLELLYTQVWLFDSSAK